MSCQSWLQCCRPWSARHGRVRNTSIVVITVELRAIKICSIPNKWKRTLDVPPSRYRVQRVRARCLSCPIALRRLPATKAAAHVCHNIHDSQHPFVRSTLRYQCQCMFFSHTCCACYVAPGCAPRQPCCRGNCSMQSHQSACASIQMVANNNAGGMLWHVHWAALVNSLRLQVQHRACAADCQTARIL